MQNPYNTRIKIKNLKFRDQTVFSHPMNNKKEIRLLLVPNIFLIVSIIYSIKLN